MTRVIMIHAERPRDAADIRQVVTDAFGGSAEADLVEALRASDAWLPGLSLVAVDGEQVVGHVLLTRGFVRGASTVPVVALAPVAVTPDRQHQGIGDALVRSVLDAARDRGERIAVVLGHPAYYPRFGFVPAVPLGLSCVFAGPGHEDSWMAMALRPGALAGVAGRVDYAAPFAAFE